MITRLLIASGIHPVLFTFAFTPALWFATWLILGVGFGMESGSAGWMALAITIADYVIGMAWIGSNNSRHTPIGEIKLGTPTATDATTTRINHLERALKQMSEDRGEEALLLPSNTGKHIAFWSDAMLEIIARDPKEYDDGIELTLGSLEYNPNPSEFYKIVCKWFGEPFKKETSVDSHDNDAAVAYWDIATVIKKARNNTDALADFFKDKGSEPARAINEQLFHMVYPNPNYRQKGTLILPFLNGTLQSGIRVEESETESAA